jgi:cephalosporin hydroxylase
MLALQNRVVRGAARRIFFEELIQHTDNFGRLTWLGYPVWQNVFDLWNIQEVLAEVRPALLIECGTNRGGSALFYARLFDQMGCGRIVTIDIEKLHQLNHPRIEFIVESSTSEAIAARVRAVATAAAAQGPVLVILDSDHTAAHVEREMELYGPLVTPGSYLHVQDGVIDELWMFRHGRPGPLAAIERFLGRHAEFEVDPARTNKFLISHHPKGWLKRVR